MLSVPGTDLSVHTVLAYMGPLTLAALASCTGLTQQRLRTHLRSHRDAYTNEVVDLSGIKMRLWSVKGPIK